MPKLLKPSEALLRVKKVLPLGYTTNIEDASPYICDNVMDLWRQGHITDDTKNQIKNHISTLLEGRFCLKDWLRMKQFVTDKEFTDDYHQSYSKLQRTRQLWLGDMILHFKAKGM